MARLLVHVEGQTEETFVNEVLAPHLYSFSYTDVSARLIGNARQRSRRGGIRAWGSVREDILKHLRSSTGSLSTTMVDYYGLPESGRMAWPGRANARQLDSLVKAANVEKEIIADIRNELGNDFDQSRFLPYVVMHEFEGLLFSDPVLFARGIGRPDLSGRFQEIRNQFANPEQINDSPVTAPSKRVENLVEGYEKPLMGTLAVLEIGLDSIRQECPGFRSWIEKLERWP